VQQLSNALDTQVFSDELERLLSASKREHPRETTRSAAKKRVAKKRVAKKRVAKKRVAKKRVARTNRTPATRSKSQ
jgi:diacylglycerol O-acyltransferase / wax synthase